MRIKGGVIWRVILGFVLLPMAGYGEEPYMLSNLVCIVAMAWAIIPGIIAVIFLSTISTVHHNYVTELVKMKPEGETIIEAIDHYRYMVFSEESYSLSVRIPPFRLYYDEQLKQWYRPPLS